MHLTLKKETTKPACQNSLAQQARFDAFVNEFNTERPHEALNMNVPAGVYVPSAKPYNGLPDIQYPFHDRDSLVTACGRLCMHRKKIISQPLWPVSGLELKKSTKAFGSSL